MLLLWLSEVCLLSDLLELAFTLNIDLPMLTKRPFVGTHWRLVLCLVLNFCHEAKHLRSESGAITIE